jgi:ABC-type antimicrobial peptide transport system permease subunit
VRRGAAVAATGIAIGLVAALFLTRLLGTMLNDVKPTDPIVFVVTAVAVLLVAFVASYLPARAAGQVDPIVVLR